MWKIALTVLLWAQLSTALEIEDTGCTNFRGENVPCVVDVGEVKEEAPCVNFRGENVPCATHVDLSCTDPSVEYIADKEDCGRYFRCVDGVLWYYNCAPGTLWDTEKQTCEREEDVTCSIQAKGVEGGESSEHPSILYQFDFGSLTNSSLRQIERELTQKTISVYDALAELPLSSLSYANVLKPLIDLDFFSQTKNSWMDYLSNVALDAGLRETANDIKKNWGEVDIDMSLRKDSFERILAFSKLEEAKHMDMETTRYLRKNLEAGKRNGLGLAGAELEEFKLVKKKISELGIAFRSCLSEDTSHIWVKEEELAGVPQDLVSTLERSATGELKVTCQYPHYHPVIKKCSVPETRFKIEKAFQSRCVEHNTKIIEELVKLRQRQADLLGYPNHAAYKQEVKMAKNPETVSSFLETLSPKLQTLWQKEREVILRYKEEDTKATGREFNGKINKEDFWYYITAIQEKEFSVDQEQLKEYFPIDVVTKGLMDIYQRLLGLTFTKVEGVPVWHPDVELYKVEDTASKETIGYFFLDLFPREGKYGHAAMWQIQPGSLDPQGNRAKAVAGMACNFPKPTSDRPSLLYHSQVKTFFHEFGHVMHGIASRTNLSYFYGTNVEGDFVEAPSQMLENWVWEEESLRLMSSHYQTKEPIPKEVLEKLVASQKSFAGAKALRQMFFATYDHMLHTRGEADTVAIAKELYKELLGIDRIDGGNIGATLGHLVGYDGGYYGYMWSEVFSHDMFQTRFAAEGILNPATGKDYRDMILRPGASLDGGVMLRNFLGREPNQDAFLRSKGLKV